MNCKKYRTLASQWWKQEIRPLLFLLLIMFSIRSSLADWNDVPSGSMQPTILVGDRVLVNKLAYDLKVPFTKWHIAEWSNPQRGDIVVFFSPKDGTRMVKRVIGLPGDTIELWNNQLVINGEPVNFTTLEPAVSQQLVGPERAQAIREIARVVRQGGRAGILDIAYVADYAREFTAAGWTVERRGFTPWIFPPTQELVARKPR